MNDTVEDEKKFREGLLMANLQIFASILFTIGGGIYVYVGVRKKRQLIRENIDDYIGL